MTQYIRVPNPLLDFPTKILEDTDIEYNQFHFYKPQALQDLNTGGQPIEFIINQEDVYTVPSKSYLSITGQLIRKDNNNPYDENDEIALINNAMMYLFSSIKYEINDLEVERITNPGQATTILGLASYPDDYSSSSALKLCWNKDTTNNANSNEFNLIPAGAIQVGGIRPQKNPNYNQGFAVRKGFLMSSDPRGWFEFIIPFDHIFGFAQYKHAIWGVKQTLTLSRLDIGDDLAIYHAQGVQDGKINLTKIIWKVPHIKIESSKAMELKSKLSTKEEILIAFSARNAESFTVPVGVQEFSHTITRSSGIKKPREIFITFQTDKAARQTQNPAVFDNLKLKNAILTLNGVRYPAFDYIIDYDKNCYTDLYERFDNFESDFHGFSPFVVGSQVNFPAFKSLYPIIRFDINHQNDTVKSGVVVDIQLDFVTGENTPANTRGFVIMLHDKVVKVKPLDEKVVDVSV